MCSFQEGSSHDRGLYLRSFEELFDLSNSDTTSTAHFNFYFTACELYNDQVPLSSTNILGDFLYAMKRACWSMLRSCVWYDKELICVVSFRHR